jgi:Putative zinc-finger
MHMDCHAFRQLHGDWVDDVLDPREGGTIAGHLAACPACTRFDTLARRALIVARNAPPIEVSSDFSARLAARIAEERRSRIAQHGPSRAERSRVVATTVGWVSWQGARRAAAVVGVVGGAMIVRTVVGGASVAPSPAGAGMGQMAGMSSASFTVPAQTNVPIAPAFDTAGYGSGAGEIVVVRAMRPIGGALLPTSDDPLLDGGERAGNGGASATTVAATAPLWPTAQMAAHAANRFAAMEFGDVVPVSVMYPQR